jgi:hypothetical protein
MSSQEEIEKMALAVEQWLTEMFPTLPKMDYSVESLQAIDHALEHNVSTFKSQEAIDGALSMFGAYLGEVIRRRIGGTWMFDEELPRLVSKNLGCSKLDGITTYPFRKVLKRLRNGEEDSVYGYALLVCNPNTPERIMLASTSHNHH